ncbi:MAG: AMP-binding protein [Pseudomonadota bacterium]
MSETAAEEARGADPCPAEFNAAQFCLARAAAERPEAEALLVVDGDAPERLRARWTFAEIDAAMRRAAGAMVAAGLSPGDRVLIRLGDGPEFPIAYFGALTAGAVAAPVSSQLSQGELEHIIRDAAPKLALLDLEAPAGLDLGGAKRLDAAALTAGPVAEIRPTRADDPALLVYTSGSSGAPKGVLHAQRSFWARRMMRLGWHDMRPADRVMHAGAFNWTYTLGVGLSDPWSVGATSILNAGARRPEAWPALAKAWAPTQFAAVPGVYRRILKYGRDVGPAFASLRHALAAGEQLSPALRGAWEAETGAPLLEALGMSEVSTFISQSPSRQADPGWTGWPQPGRVVAVLDHAEGRDAPQQGPATGVLAVRRDDPGLMLGYWGRPEDTAAALRGDWFVTGDLVERRADGALRYLGRADDQMNAQGYRVAPLEVEAAFADHPGVAECAAAELPISEGLSVIALWITPAAADGGDDGRLDPAALRAHAGARLADYKTPRAFYLVDPLPRSANGKLLRRQLSAAVGQKLEETTD